MQIGRRRRDDQESSPGQDRSRGDSVEDVPGQAIAANVFPPGIAVVKLDILQVPPIGARGRIIHKLGNHQGGAPAARPQAFIGTGHRPDETVAHIGDIPELGRRGLARGVAADGQAEVNLARQGNGRAAQLRPGLAIITGKTAEGIARAFEPKPSIGIINRELAAELAGAAGGVAPFKERADHRWGGERRRKAAARIQRLTRHQTGLGPSVDLIHGLNPRLHVEVTEAELISELELVGGSPDVTAAAHDIKAVGRRGDVTAESGVADVRRRKGRGGKGRLRIGGDRVGRSRAVAHIADCQRIGGAVSQGWRGEDDGFRVRPESGAGNGNAAAQGVVKEAGRAGGFDRFRENDPHVGSADVEGPKERGRSRVRENRQSGGAAGRVTHDVGNEAAELAVTVG